MKCRACRVDMTPVRDDPALVTTLGCPECGRRVVLHDVGYMPPGPPIAPKPVTFTPEELAPGSQDSWRVFTREEKERHAEGMRNSVRSRATQLGVRTCAWEPCGKEFTPKIENQAYDTDACREAAQLVRQRERRSSSVPMDGPEFHASCQ